MPPHLLPVHSSRFLAPLFCLLAAGTAFVGCDLFGDGGPSVRFAAPSELSSDSLRASDIQKISFNDGTLRGKDLDEKIDGGTIGSSTHAPTPPDSLKVSFIAETDRGTYAEGRFTRQLGEGEYIVAFYGNIYDRAFNSPERPLEGCWGCLDIYSFPIDKTRSPVENRRAIDSVFVQISKVPEDGVAY